MTPSSLVLLFPLLPLFFKLLHKFLLFSLPLNCWFPQVLAFSSDSTTFQGKPGHVHDFHRHLYVVPILTNLS